MENVKCKKIMFLVTQSEMGGAQKYVYQIINGLDRDKYNFALAAGEGDGELFQKLENTGVKPAHLKHMKRTPWPWQALLAVKEIFDLLNNEAPGVLFLCSTGAGFLGSIAGFLHRLNNRNRRRVKIIYRIGGWAFRDPRPFWKNWLIILAEKLTAGFKDIIIVNSESDRAIALKYEIVPREKIKKIYNGVDADSLNFLPRDDARKQLGITAQNSPIIGAVANFYKTKGLGCLIQAMARLNSARSVIIGDGILRPELEDQIRRLGLGNKIILAGRIPNAHKYLKAFDIFALPSLKEGFPWVILEAAAAGLPIVATKVGAVPEILAEEFLVKPGDPEELAKKINWVLAHPTPPKLKQNFSLQKMLEETEKLL